MLLKTLVLSLIIFTFQTDQLNNDAYDIRMINNNSIPGPVAINNENPGPFIDLRMDDYEIWEQEFKLELGYKADKECPSTGSCDIDVDVWLNHYPTLNEWVKAYFLPEDREWALRVAFCESSAKPEDQFSEVINDESGATGWFQHLPKFWIERSYRSGFTGFAMNHPKANVGVASWLFYEYGGSRHWNSSKSCWQ
tara:strand:- start:1921 stop:2505 length:585 start_codon:yes stop_codon:yes gene_type:complete